jgi:hypothetical protein
VLGAPRSTIYARRAQADARRRPGPATSISDPDLLGLIHQVLVASPFAGEGYRKVRARLRREHGVQVGGKRVLRLLCREGLLAPQQVRGRRKPRPHDGTIIPQAPNQRWAPTPPWPGQGAARRVARAAGRELAVLNGIDGRGYGWIRRRAPVWPLRAIFRDYAEFVTSYLPDPWPGPLAPLFSAAELDRLWSLVASERRRELGGARLAHGDFDTTPIFQVDGRYTGLIDFGEIRGTDPLFDLGHFLLHDQESTPIPLVDELLAGYAEVVVLPVGHEELVRRSAILLGLRQLARWLGPFRNLRAEHPAATGRAARLRQLLVDP